jgi:1,4-alpha-glucan branching enzyme
VGCPIGGQWQEVFNSDASIYGGTDCGNLGGVQAKDYATHGRPHTLEATMPPLGVVVFKPES